MARSFVSGLRGALRALRRAQRAADDARRPALEEWAKDTAATAKKFSPVLTGRMRRQIDYRVNKADANVGVYGSSRRYAGYVHGGTSKMEANPWMARAFAAHRNDLARSYRRHFRLRMRY